MTTRIGQYFDSSELSLAAYSDFSGISRLSSGALDPDTIRVRLTTLGGLIPWSEKTSDFSTTEAQHFVDRLDVLDQYTADPLTNGFSATLFRDKANGNLYFVNRGTSLTDIGDLVTDAILAAGGKPLYQILDMVNYYLRLKAGSGTVAQQVEAVIDSDPQTPLFRWGTAVVGTGSGIGNAPVIVAGHSLGGYLGTIFGFLFGNAASAVYTFNAPGSWGVEGTLRQLAQLLGNANPSYASDRQTNLIGDYVVSSVPGHRGTDIRVFEEGNAHSQKVLTDSIALQNLLATLDKSVTASIADAIFKAASAVDTDSLEQTLDKLRKVILGQGVAPTKAVGASDSQSSREAFYANLYQLLGSSQFNAIAGKSGTSIVSLATRGAADLATLAANNIAYRYALKELNPFAVLGADYANFNNSQQLDLYDPTTEKGEMTNEYIADRATMLGWANQYNAADGNIALRSDRIETYQFVDKTLKDASGNDLSLTVAGRQPQSIGNPAMVIFGSAQDDQLTGGDVEAGDRLYGGAANDSISANGGNDYLEGNLGDDTLSGDDGNDTLVGGQGTDSYLLMTGDGDDIVDDSDGQGEIRIGATRLAGGPAIAAGLWQETVNGNGVLYSWAPGADGRGDLLIQSTVGATTVKHFKSGDLGIVLPTPVAESIPLPTIT